MSEPLFIHLEPRAPFGEAYEKSDKAALVAVAVAVFAVIKEQRATSPCVAVYRALPDLLAELVGRLKPV